MGKGNSWVVAPNGSAKLHAPNPELLRREQSTALSEPQNSPRA